MDTIEYTTIQLTPNQSEFLAWCNLHYQQLLGIKNSRVLDKGERSFTVHLKPHKINELPEIDKIELHDNFYPNRIIA